MASLPALAQTQVQNSASIQLAAGQADSNPANDTDSVIVNIYAVDLAKSANPASDTPVGVGTTISYTLTTTVTSSDTTAPIELTDTLSAGLNVVSPLPAECVQNGQVLTCTVPAGTPVGDYTIQYSATVGPEAGASVTNTVTGGNTCTSGCTTSHPVFRGVILTKAWANAIASDSVSLRIAGGSAGVIDQVEGSSSDAATTPATANAGPNATVTAIETFTSGQQDNYDTTLICQRDIDGADVPVNGTGLFRTFSMPVDSGVTCTFSNVRKQVDLTLVKTWANALAGETATVTSTGFTNNASTGLSTADAAGNNTTTGTAVTVFAGESGTISEVLSNAGNYDATLTCTGNTQALVGNTLTIDSADTAITCTQTNTRRSATLTLVKTWANALAGETATVTSTGFTNNASTGLSTADAAGNNTTTGTAVTVFAGESGTISEVLSNAGNYDATLTCTGNTQALVGNTLTIDSADTAITCTQTNTRRSANLTLRKSWVNAAIGETVDITATGSVTTPITLNSVADTASETDSATAQPVFAGEVITLAEAFTTAANADNYATALTCTGTTGLAGESLTIGAGDSDIVCTYTNTRRQTTLQLFKQWAANSLNGDVAQLGATSGLLTNTDAFTSTASNAANSNIVTVFAGEQATLPAETMSGGSLANYSVALTCTGGALSGADGKASNTLDILDTDTALITCTYTNTRSSTTLTLEKIWLNGLPTDEVEIVATGLTPFRSVANGGPSQTDTANPQTVFAGDVLTITESFLTISSNLYDSSLACVGTSGLSVIDPTSGTLTVGATDGPITCSFTNDRRSAQLIVRKVWVGGPAATVSIPASTGFTNNAPTFTSSSPGPDQVGPVEVFVIENGTLGAEVFTVGNQADYTSTLICDGSDTNPADGLAIAIADAGNTITCTYSNTFVPRPELDLVKTTTVTSVTTVGQIIPYSVTVTNTGNVPLTNVGISDPLVSNLNCNPTLPTDLAVGASIICDGSYTVQQADIDRQNSADGTDNGTITNTATATGTDPDGGSVTDTGSVDTTLPVQTFSVGFTKAPILADTNGSVDGSVGEIITYNFTVQNTGNTTIDSIVITDPLLPNLSCAASGPLVPNATLTFGSPQPPVDRLCTGNTYIITQADIDNRGGGDNDIDNTASVTATAPGGGTDSEDASAQQPLDLPVADIALGKTASPTTVTAAGEVITYTFTVTNPGTVTLSDVSVTDPKPGMSAITCQAPYSPMPFDLPPGETAICSATYTVTQADIDGGATIGNTGTAGGEFEGTPVTDTDDVVVNNGAGPGNAAVTKTADKTAVAVVGELVTYAFSVNNTSQRTLLNIRIVSDSLMSGLSCTPIPSLAPGASVTFTCSAGTNVYAVQQSDIDNNGNPVAGSGDLVNTVTVAADYLEGGNTVTVTRTDDAIVDLPARTAGLVLTKSSDVQSITAPNQQITYGFEVRNNGTVTLANVQISDNLLGAGFSCVPIATLAPGATATFVNCVNNVYTVTQADIDSGSTDADPGDQQIDNTATVTATPPTGMTLPPVTDNHEVNLPIRTAGMTLVKTADPTSVSAPGTINYTFAVTNNGNVTINDVTLTDPTLNLSCPTSPAVSIAPGATVTFGGAAPANVICTGTSRAVTQNDIDTQTSLDNTATAAGTTEANGPISAADTEQVAVVKNPALVFDKTANRTAVNLPGDVIEYTMTGSNAGNVTLANVNVVDPLLPVLSCTPTMPIAALAPGGTFSCTGSYAASQQDFDTLGGGDSDIDNTATASWDGGSQSDSAAVDVPLPNQSLTIDKTARAPSVEFGLDSAVTDAGNAGTPGDTITYTFVVENTGNQTLADLVVNDANLDATAVCDRTTLAAEGPDSIATCTGVHTITQAEMDNGLVANTATASGTPPNSARITSAPDNLNVPLPPAPVITLAKTASAPTVVQGALPAVTDAGDQITYSFTVTNSGNVTLSNIVVNDPLLSPSAVSCSPTTLAPGESATCVDRTYILIQSDLDAGNVTNVATATGTPPTPGTPVTDDSTTATDLPPAPELTVVKTASPNTVTTAGETVTYSFEVTNTGNVTMDGIVIDEVAFSGTGTLGTISCPDTTLSPSEATTCTASYTVTQADIDAGTITNTATATGTDPGGDDPTTSQPDDETVAVDQNPNQSIVKSDPPANNDADGSGTVSLGDTLTYTVTVTNTGNTTLTPVVVDDPLLTPRVQTCANVAPGGTCVLTGTYVVTQADVDAGQVSNTATSTSPACPLGDATVGKCVSPPVVTPVPQNPNQSIVKSDPPANNDADGSGTVSLGDTLTYTVTVTNTGNTTLTPVVVDDPLLTPRVQTCANVAPGGTCVLTGTYVVTQADVDAGQVSNTATSTSPACPLGDATVGKCVSPPVVTPVPQNPNQSIVKSDPPANNDADGSGTVSLGDTLTYTVTVTNTGNTTLTPVVVDDPLLTPRVQTCANVAPGGTCVLTGTYVVTQADVDAGQVSNTATSTSPACPLGDATVGKCVSPPVVTPVPQNPNQSIVKSDPPANNDADGSGTVSLGDTLTYTVTVTNTGNTTLTPVVVDDPLLTPRVQTCANVAPGGTCVLTGTYVVTQADVDAGQVSNTATSTSPACPLGDATVGKCVSPPVVTPVPQNPNQSIVKSDPPANNDADGSGTVSLGDTLTYTVTVTNTGNTTLTPVVVDDPLLTPRVQTCANVAPGGTCVLTGTYVVTQADVDAGQVSNTATSTSPACPLGDATVGKCVSPPVVTPVPQNPNQSIVKSDPPANNDADGSGTVSLGDTLTYTVTVTNTGNTTLTPVVVDDPLLTPRVQTCANVAPGGTCVLTGTYVVTQADVDAGQVSNTATSTSPACPLGDATVGKCVSPPVVTPVPQNPNQSIVKSDPPANNDADGSGTVSLGDTLTYTVTVTNTGNTTLTPVVVDDPLLTPRVQTCANVAPGGTCVLTGTYVVTQADVDAGQVSNTATSTSPACPLGDATVGKCVSPPVVTPVLPPEVTYEKSAALPGTQTEVAVGDVITYTLTVNVANSQLISDLVLVDTLGTGLTFGSVISQNPANAFNCTGGLSCTLPMGTLPGTYAVIYTATVNDQASGAVSNAVLGNGGGPRPPLCSGDCEVDVPVTDPAVTYEKAATLPAGQLVVSVGDVITYTLTVEVANSQLTSDLNLVDTLGTGLTFGAVTSQNPADAFTCTGGLSCILPTGTVPGTYTVSYTATVNDQASGRVSNAVLGTGGTPNPPTCSDDCDVDVPVAAPAIETIKEMTANDDADGNGEVSTGDTLTYTITTTNTGNVPLVNVVVSDPITTPASQTCVLLPPGATCVLTGTYTVTLADSDAGQVVNTATVTTEPPPGVPPLPPEACPAGSTAEVCQPTVTVPVIQHPAIATTKSAVLSVDNATPGKGNVGDVITYTVTATNIGNVTLNDLTVTDTFQGGAPVTLACSPSTLAPGQVATCDSYDHTITEAEAGSEGGTLLNTVLTEANSVTGNSSVTVNATANVVVEVQNEPAQLRVTKIAGVREINIGDLVRYTVTVENVGDIDLVDGYLIDTPPLGFTYVEGSLQGDDDDDYVTAVGQSPLRVEHLDIAAGNTATLVYLMRVGAGVRPGVQINQAQAFDPGFDVPASNVATAEVVLASDSLLDESLISGTAFSDRDGDGWQDSASLSHLKVRGGFAASAYIANSTTVDRGEGPQPEPDASSPMLHGIAVGKISGRQSVVDPAEAHQVVIRQRLRELAFTDDFVLTSAQGASVRMAADGSTRIETQGDAAKGLTAAAPTVQRQVAQGADGYVVDYIIRNEGIDERGVPGVRIASVEGLLIETDQYGRYHLAGIDAGKLARGRNFILKVDPATLPVGAEMTTDNPLVRRITGGVPTRFAFGIKLPEEVIPAGREEVELELGEVLFTPGSATLRDQYLSAIHKMAEQVKRYQGGEVIITATGEYEALAFARANAVQAALKGVLDEASLRGLTISVRAQAEDPATLLAGMGEGGPLLGILLFDTDKETIKPQFASLLDEVAAALETSNGGNIAIVGHADRRGSRSYNTALGLRRAKAVYDAIAQRLSPEVRAKVTVQASDDPTAPVDSVNPPGEN